MKAKLIAAGALALIISGCAKATHDISDKFEAVEIGENRQHVIERLGPPDTVRQLQLPLLKLESLSWNDGTNSYTVWIVGNWVTGKSINDQSDDSKEIKI